MRHLDALRSRPRRETLITGGCIVFLAWFTMKFHMDNANNSETIAYVNHLITSATQGTIPADQTGHYTMLAAYVMWPISASIQRVAGDHDIRGLVFSLLFLSAAVFGAAYTWYRCIGLGWLTSLFGLMLLSVSLTFAMLIRGWEIDKLIEPALFLLAALAAWHRRYPALPVLAALAAANRETGAFLPLVVLAGLAHHHGSLRAALKQWPFWACAIICALEVAWFRQFGPTPTVDAFWKDLRTYYLIYVIGGLCLTPILATAWVQSSSLAVRRLYYLLAPAWVAFVLATDRIEQGALLLTPLALLFVPMTLAGVEQLLQTPRQLVTPPA
jgi:hypothetical protein